MLRKLFWSVALAGIIFVAGYYTGAYLEERAKKWAVTEVNTLRARVAELEEGNWALISERIQERETLKNIYLHLANVESLPHSLDLMTAGEFARQMNKCLDKEKPTACRDYRVDEFPWFKIVILNKPVTVIGQ